MRASRLSAEEIDRHLRDAVALHQRGDLKGAEARYADLHRHIPDHPDLLHLYGTVLVQMGRSAEATPLLERGIAVRPQYAPTLEISGTAYLILGQATRAVAVLEQAATLQPDSANAASRLGDAYLACGQNEAATDAFRKALSLDPNHREALMGLITTQAHLGQVSDAVVTARACVFAHPTFVGGYIALGTLLAQVGLLADAETSAREALRLQPNLAGGQHLLAKILRRLGREHEAEVAYRAAFDLGLRNPALLTECAELLIDAGKPDDAEALLREALTATPNAADALTTLGRIAEIHGRLDQSITLHDRAIALEPANANAHVNRGTAKRFTGDVNGALADFNRALALKPGLPAAIASRGITLLTMGRLAEGWPDFRARVKAADSARDLSADHPWDGTSLEGKRILVWTEYGLGDEIMAASLLPDLLARVAHCTLACSPRLISLFQRAFPNVHVVSAEAPIAGSFDARLPLMDVAQWLRPSLADFPRHPSYLRADTRHAQALRARYGADGTKIVGISWRSSARGTGPFKSTRLADWADVLKTPGVRFVSLQYGADQDEIREARNASGTDVILDPTVDAIGDLEMYAAQVDAMDLVISVSNTAVHLAGGLGKPTWLLAPARQGAHWYWFETADSPWYPGLRIFRQYQAGEWHNTLSDVTTQLAAWAGLKARA